MQQRLSEKSKQSIFLGEKYYEGIPFSKIILKYGSDSRVCFGTSTWLYLGLIVHLLVFFSLASFYQFCVVCLCLLLLSVCWLSPPRTRAASNRKFKYYFKKVSCLRCQPSHYHHTSSARFAWTLEN